MLLRRPALKGYPDGGDRAPGPSRYASFADRGLPRATLEVDTRSTTDALRLYERLGMRTVRGWDTYEKAVEGAPDGER